MKNSGLRPSLLVLLSVSHLLSTGSAEAGVGTQFSQGSIGPEQKPANSSASYAVLPSDKPLSSEEAFDSLQKQWTPSSDGLRPAMTAIDGTSTTLRGNISILDEAKLEGLHEQFKERATKYKNNLLIRKEAFNDFIKKNNFLANVFLIRLSPPDVTDARQLFSDSRLQLVTAQQQLTSSASQCQQSSTSLAESLTKEHSADNNLKWIEPLLTRAKAALEQKNAALNVPGETPTEATKQRMQLSLAQQRVNQLVTMKVQYQREFELQKAQTPVDKLNELVSNQLLMASFQQIAEARGDLQNATLDLARSHSPDKDKLPVRDNHAYYLLVFNYNLPAVRPFGLMINYRFARFCAQAMVRKSKVSISDHVIPPDFDQSYRYENVPIIASYPTNSTMSADLTNTKKLELQAKPEYSGVAAGSITYSDQTQLKYQLKLPRVVGMNTSDGEVQWTYYPAKAQQIAFGAQTGYAVISVPQVSEDDLLQLDLTLEYEYKAFKLPLGENKEYASIATRFGDALTEPNQIDDFRRLYMRNLGTDDQIQIERLLELKDPVKLFTPPGKDAKQKEPKDGSPDGTAAGTDASGGGSAGGKKSASKNPDKAGGKGGTTPAPVQSKTKNGKSAMAPTTKPQVGLAPAHEHRHHHDPVEDPNER